MGNSIENRLKEIRTEKGMTQFELAMALKVMPATISRWELGRHKLPIEKAKEIAVLFNINWQTIYE